MLRSCLFTLIAFIILTHSGCSSRGSLPTPRARIGALPFPGITSLYAAANPDNVAPHHYRGRLTRIFEAEGDRGIVYTRKAGFVDVAHLREAMDWTWYIGQRLQADANQQKAAATSATKISFEGSTLTLNVPTTASPELLNALASQAAYRLLTWHEISTWYGYSMVPLVSERRSTFTVDDTTSHVIGVLIGHRMLSSATTLDDYDTLAGEQLATMLQSLEASTEADTSKMCESVKGTWWSGVTPLLIDTNVALESNEKHPALAPTSTTHQFEVGQPLPSLPSLPPTFNNWYKLEPCSEVRSDVKRVLAQSTINNDEDLNRLIRTVGEEITQSRRGATVLTDSVMNNKGNDFRVVARQ